MSNSKQIVARRPRVILAAMLAFAGASAAHAAGSGGALPDSTAQAPIEEVQELDEIWVRGKSLSDMIVDAEDEFFRLYNQLNRNHDYDVRCDYVRLDRDSLAMSRTCTPMYRVYDDAFSDGSTGYTYVLSSLSGSSGCNNTVYAQTVGQDLYSNDYYFQASCEQASSFRYGGIFAPSSPGYIGSSPERTAQRRQEYMRSIMRAIYRDQRLLDKANALSDLYQEMSEIQGQYVRLKAEDRARADAERRDRREKRRGSSAPPPAPSKPRL